MLSRLSLGLLASAISLASLPAIAKEAGFMISADDLAKAQSELSEEELEGVTGGGWGDKIVTKIFDTPYGGFTG